MQHPLEVVFRVMDWVWENLAKLPYFLAELGARKTYHNLLIYKIAIPVCYLSLITAVIALVVSAVCRS